MSALPRSLPEGVVDASATRSSRTVGASVRPASTVGEVFDRWPVEGRVFGEASVSARRFTTPAAEASPAGRAWAGRVDAAVHGMDAFDSTGLDVWMDVHHRSTTPEVLEARLVAAWETRQLAEAAERAAAEVGDQLELPAVAGDDAPTAELPVVAAVHTSDDADGWDA